MSRENLGYYLGAFGFTEHWVMGIERGLHGRVGLSWKIALGIMTFMKFWGMDALSLEVMSFGLEVIQQGPEALKPPQEWNPFSRILMCLNPASFWLPV